MTLTADQRFIFNVVHPALDKELIDRTIIYLMGVADGKHYVVIENRDGRQIKVPMSRYSDSDDARAEFAANFLLALVQSK